MGKKEIRCGICDKKMKDLKDWNNHKSTKEHQNNLHKKLRGSILKSFDQIMPKIPTFEDFFSIEEIKNDKKR